MFNQEIVLKRWAMKKESSDGHQRAGERKDPMQQVYSFSLWVQRCKQPTHFPSLMVSHDHFRLDNISLLSWIDEQNLGGHSHSGEWKNRKWISAFGHLAYKSSLQERELPPEKLRFFYHRDTNCRSRNKANNEKIKIKFCSTDNFWMLVKWPRNSLRCKKKWRKPLMAAISNITERKITRGVNTTDWSF